MEENDENGVDEMNCDNQKLRRKAAKMEWDELVDGRQMKCSGMK